MRVTEADLPGVLLIEPRLFPDERGLFLETYHAERYGISGLADLFVQDNLSFSRKGVLRGLHYQIHRAQGKLVTAVQGKIFDVAVDIRRGSPTFGHWFGAVLSSDNFRQMFVPKGYAHGFCVLSDTATVCYKCTDFYSPSGERGLRWDDPRLAIQWPVEEPIISDKDRMYPTLETISEDDLPSFEG